MVMNPGDDDDDPKETDPVDTDDDDASSGGGGGSAGAGDTSGGSGSTTGDPGDDDDDSSGGGGGSGGGSGGGASATSDGGGGYSGGGDDDDDDDDDGSGGGASATSGGGGGYSGGGSGGGAVNPGDDDEDDDSPTSVTGGAAGSGAGASATSGGGGGYSSVSDEAFAETLLAREAEAERERVADKAAADKASDDDNDDGSGGGASATSGGGGGYSGGGSGGGAVNPGDDDEDDDSPTSVTGGAAGSGGGASATSGGGGGYSGGGSGGGAVNPGDDDEDDDSPTSVTGGAAVIAASASATSGGRGRGRDDDDDESAYEKNQRERAELNERLRERDRGTGGVGTVDPGDDDDDDGSGGGASATSGGGVGESGGGGTVDPGYHKDDGPVLASQTYGGVEDRSKTSVTYIGGKFAYEYHADADADQIAAAAFAGGYSDPRHHDLSAVERERLAFGSKGRGQAQAADILEKVEQGLEAGTLTAEEARRSFDEFTRLRGQAVTFGLGSELSAMEAAGQKIRETDQTFGKAALKQLASDIQQSPEDLSSADIRQQYEDVSKLVQRYGLPSDEEGGPTELTALLEDLANRYREAQSADVTSLIEDNTRISQLIADPEADPLELLSELKSLEERGLGLDGFVLQNEDGTSITLSEWGKSLAAAVNARQEQETFANINDAIAAAFEVPGASSSDPVTVGIAQQNGARMLLELMDSPEFKGDAKVSITAEDGTPRIVTLTEYVEEQAKGLRAAATASFQLSVTNRQAEVEDDKTFKLLRDADQGYEPEPGLSNVDHAQALEKLAQEAESQKNHPDFNSDMVVSIPNEDGTSRTITAGGYIAEVAQSYRDAATGNLKASVANRQAEVEDDKTFKLLRDADQGYEPEPGLSNVDHAQALEKLAQEAESQKNHPDFNSDMVVSIPNEDGTSRTITAGGYIAEVAQSYRDAATGNLKASVANRQAEVEDGKTFKLLRDADQGYEPEPGLSNVDHAQALEKLAQEAESQKNHPDFNSDMVVSIPNEDGTSRTITAGGYIAEVAQSYRDAATGNLKASLAARKSEVADERTSKLLASPDTSSADYAGELEKLAQNTEAIRNNPDFNPDRVLVITNEDGTTRFLTAGDYNAEVAQSYRNQAQDELKASVAARQSELADDKTPTGYARSFKQPHQDQEINADVSETEASHFREAKETGASTYFITDDYTNEPVMGHKTITDADAQTEKPPTRYSLTDFLNLKTWTNKKQSRAVMVQADAEERYIGMTDPATQTLWRVDPDGTKTALTGTYRDKITGAAASFVPGGFLHVSEKQAAKKKPAQDRIYTAVNQPMFSTDTGEFLDPDNARARALTTEEAKDLAFIEEVALRSLSDPTLPDFMYSPTEGGIQFPGVKTLTPEQQVEAFESARDLTHREAFARGQNIIDMTPIEAGAELLSVIPGAGSAIGRGLKGAKIAVGTVKPGKSVIKVSALEGSSDIARHDQYMRRIGDASSVQFSNILDVATKHSPITEALRSDWPHVQKLITGAGGDLSKLSDAQLVTAVQPKNLKALGKTADELMEGLPAERQFSVTSAATGGKLDRANELGLGKYTTAVPDAKYELRPGFKQWEQNVPQAVKGYLYETAFGAGGGAVFTGGFQAAKGDFDAGQLAKGALIGGLSSSLSRAAIRPTKAVTGRVPGRVGKELQRPVVTRVASGMAGGGAVETGDAVAPWSPGGSRITPGERKQIGQGVAFGAALDAWGAQALKTMVRVPKIIAGHLPESSISLETKGATTRIPVKSTATTRSPEQVEQGIQEVFDSLPMHVDDPGGFKARAVPTKSGGSTDPVIAMALQRKAQELFQGTDLESVTVRVPETGLDYTFNRPILERALGGVSSYHATPDVGWASDFAELRPPKKWRSDAAIGQIYDQVGRKLGNVKWRESPVKVRETPPESPLPKTGSEAQSSVDLFHARAFEAQKWDQLGRNPEDVKVRETPPESPLPKTGSEAQSSVDLFHARAFEAQKWDQLGRNPEDVKVRETPPESPLPKTGSEAQSSVDLFHARAFEAQKWDQLGRNPEDVKVRETPPESPLPKTPMQLASEAQPSDMFQVRASKAATIEAPMFSARIEAASGFMKGSAFGEPAVGPSPTGIRSSGLIVLDTEWTFKQEFDALGPAGFRQVYGNMGVPESTWLKIYQGTKEIESILPVGSWHPKLVPLGVKALHPGGVGTGDIMVSPGFKKHVGARMGGLTFTPLEKRQMAAQGIVARLKRKKPLEIDPIDPQRFPDAVLSYDFPRARDIGSPPVDHGPGDIPGSPPGRGQPGDIPGHPRLSPGPWSTGGHPRLPPGPWSTGGHPRLPPGPWSTGGHPRLPPGPWSTGGHPRLPPGPWSTGGRPRLPPGA